MEALYEALSKGTIDEAREHYERLLAARPTFGLLWYSYAQFEYRLNNTTELEAIFAGALKNVLDLRLWRLYLQHVRRVNRTISSPAAASAGDSSSSAVISKAYEFCLGNVGHDVYSGATWLEYVEWLRGVFLPHLPPDTSDYERQGKIEQVRKAYHRALSAPLDGLEHIWHSYDQFEAHYNKAAAKKMLSERSPTYMHCRSLVKELKDIVDGIDREWMPCEDLSADDKWQDRLVTWMRWIDWERQNPAKLDKVSVHQRVLYAFRRALACCRYIPELWMHLLAHVEQHSSLATPSDIQPIGLLRQAVDACPKSLALSFTLVDRLERTTLATATSSSSPSNTTGPEQSSFESGKAVFEALIGKLSDDRAIDGAAASTAPADASVYGDQDRADISLAFLQYMQWARRAPGGGGIAAARAVFARARKHPAILHPVYTANALLEYHTRRDAVVAGKIFELGLGRFGSQPAYLADYLRHLIGMNDDQNARALFERSVNSLLVSSKEAAYGIWCMYLEYEYRYGEWESFRALEKRFREQYPNDDAMAATHRQYGYDSLELQLFDYRQAIGQSVDPLTLAARIGRQRMVPFVVGEPLIDLLGRLPLPSKYDGPLLDHDLVLRAISQVRLTAVVPAAGMAGMPKDKSGRRRSRSPATNRRR